jgi:protein-L-isoaspartate(D-aspartate) O-methyltransferase
MPSIMMEMLGLLDVRDGNRVLEVGTGTGYNAAWLCHRLGDECVTTIEVDSAVFEQALRNLKDAGYRPQVLCVDGEQGWPDGAPFDRVIATCTVREIPYAWVEQMRPGGKIVAPWGSSYFSHSFATLDVTEDGRATGTFSGTPAFMWLRGQRGGSGHLSDFLHHRQEATRRRTTVNP